MVPRRRSGLLKNQLRLQKETNAKIFLAHVIDTRTFASVEAYDRTIAERADKYAVELLEKYKKQAIEAGISSIDYILEFGSPKVRIPKDLARKHRVDLIICGATGLNAVERFLIGSVSEHITRYAPCDVLVVRTEKDE